MQPGSCCQLWQRGDHPAVLPDHIQGWAQALDCQADDEKAGFGRQVEEESWGACHPVTAAWGSFLTARLYSPRRRTTCRRSWDGGSWGKTLIHTIL